MFIQIVYFNVWNNSKIRTENIRVTLLGKIHLVYNILEIKEISINDLRCNWSNGVCRNLQKCTKVKKK